jgi:hypothetical protein
MKSANGRASHGTPAWAGLILALASLLSLPGCGANANSAAEALATRGYAVDAKSACKAAGLGDVGALRLLAQAGVATPSLVQEGDRFCLEAALIGRGAKVDIGGVLSEIKAAKAELNRAYPSATGMTARDVPNAEQLARAAGHRPSSLYAGGQVVEATPLMWAVWAGDRAAVEALLAHGADPNLPSHVAVHVSAKDMVVDGQAIKSPAALVRISANPLFEAHRLQHKQIAQLLARQGAKPSLSSVKG